MTQISLKIRISVCQRVIFNFLVVTANWCFSDRDLFFNILSLLGVCRKAVVKSRQVIQTLALSCWSVREESFTAKTNTILRVSSAFFIPVLALSTALPAKEMLINLRNLTHLISLIREAKRLEILRNTGTDQSDVFSIS